MTLEIQHAVPTDSEAPDVNQKIQEFIVKHSIHVRKHNLRDWGSYDILIGLDGQSWFVGDTYGWGFAPEYAAAETIRKIIEKGPDEQFINFLHKERIDELTQIVKGV